MKQKYIYITLFVVVVAGILGYAAMKGDSTTPADTMAPVTDTTGAATPVATDPNATTTGTAPTAATASPYKDGTYSATGEYRSPGGQQQVSVNLTLKAGVVTDLTVTPGSTDRESTEYQQKFIGGIKAYVVGKKLDDVAVTKVSGSSLTGTGFNNALSKIKVEASA